VSVLVQKRERSLRCNNYLEKEGERRNVHNFLLFSCKAVPFSASKREKKRLPYSTPQEDWKK